VQIDLADRPGWLYEKNPSGRVPVLEDELFVLPESQVIMEYLEERYPEPPLLPADPAERALARLAIFDFDRFGDAYYALRRGEERARAWLERQLDALDARLAVRPFLSGSEFGLADIAYVPWILRARERMEVELEPYPAVEAWLERVSARPSVAAELELVAAL
jgi:glutathione S-transferase